MGYGTLSSSRNPLKIVVIIFFAIVFFGSSIWTINKWTIRKQRLNILNASSKFEIDKAVASIMKGKHRELPPAQIIENSKENVPTQNNAGKIPFSIPQEINEEENVSRDQHFAVPSEIPAKSKDSPASIIIENTESTGATILFSGIVSTRIVLTPNSSTSISLPGGTYSIAAVFDDPSIIPFAGVDTYLSGVMYERYIYIINRQIPY
ncbi:MAG TPA: hypothetical protein P5150_01755 [Candidatus Ratteibacteria bacterium]|nr:hypothetical protein [Candidatus Ratteibacteria bacterium]